LYINLLTQLKNAQAVKKENIKFPYSKTDEAVLKVLTENKYINGFEKKGQRSKKFLDIRLKYEKGEGAIGKGVINEIKFLSKPSIHQYVGYKEIKPVKRGYGLLVISTSKGIMSGQEAKKQKLGGELLFTIW